MPNLEATEVAARLLAAALAGAILGINRDLRHKPAGLRTHALVSLGSAVACLIAVSTGSADANNLSRVVQGLVTGVGFIGAGVIVHHDAQQRATGLTTAASIWIAAAVGAASGSGCWLTALFALALTLIVLVIGGPIERAFEGRFGRKDDRGAPDSTG